MSPEKAIDIGILIPVLNGLIGEYAAIDHIDRLKARPHNLVKVFIDICQSVFFDYEKRDIVFRNFVFNAVKIMKDVEMEDDVEGENEDEDAKKEGDVDTTMKLMELKEDIGLYLQERFSERKDWFDVPILPGITSVTANNLSGFNDDPRSHRGDCLVGDTDGIGKRVSVGTPDEKKVKDEDEDEEGKEDDYYQRIDEEMQENPYTLINDQGTTWGDLMQAVLMAKGSKSDWWYELITGIKVVIKGNQLIVTFGCDHGS